MKVMMMMLLLGRVTIVLIIRQWFVITSSRINCSSRFHWINHLVGVSNNRASSGGGRSGLRTTPPMLVVVEIMMITMVGRRTRRDHHGGMVQGRVTGTSLMGTGILRSADHTRHAKALERLVVVSRASGNNNKRYQERH